MGELYFSVNSAWPEQSRVKDIDSVSSHNNLDGLCRFETVELVEQLKHGSLYF